MGPRPLGGGLEAVVTVRTHIGEQHLGHRDPVHRLPRHGAGPAERPPGGTGRLRKAMSLTNDHLKILIMFDLSRLITITGRKSAKFSPSHPTGC
ncbi:hypothetical protein GCM10017744_018390 [Streptomyces antimycoticus]